MEPTQTSKEDAPKEPTLKEAGGEPTPIETPPAGEVTPPEVDYKKKFGESTTENQRIMEEKKKLEEDKAELESKLAQKASETPSDEELRRKYPDWDLLDENGQEAIKREIDRENRVRKLEEKAAWEGDFKTLLAKPEYASLKEKEADFKAFAYANPTVKSLEILAQSFLFKSGVKVEETETPPKRQGLEKPTKGPVETSQVGLTLAQITALRKEQPKRYLKMVREGKLKDIPEK